MDEWTKGLFSDDGLSATEALERACAAPYGANIASAGLLLAVFFRAHRNAKDIQVVKNGEAIEIDAIASLFPDKSALDPKDFKDVRFVKAVSGDDSPWKTIVDDWPDCMAYREKIAFRERIDAVRKTHPAIPPAFKFKIQEVEREIAEARRQMDASDEKVSEHMNLIEVSTRREDVYKLAFGASLLTDDLKLRVSQAYLWDKTLDIAPLEMSLRESRQRILAWFPAWIQSFNPRGDSPDAVAEYRQIANDRMGRSLRNLGLANEEDQLKRRVARVLQHLDAISAARARKREAEAWAESHSMVPPNLSCAQIDAWKAECDQHRDVLQRSASSMRTVNSGVADEIAVIYQTLNGIKDELAKARQALDRRARKIYDKELNPETARDLLVELEALIRLYDGSDTNLDDFRDARNEVDAYLVQVGVLSNPDLHEAVFDERARQGKTDFVEKYRDLEPLWDPEEAYEGLVELCRKKRARESKAWIASMEEKYADPNGFSMQEANSALSELDACIPCFVSGDAARLNRLRKRLENQLDSLGVEWLVAKFLELSETAKKQFLAKIKENFRTTPKEETASKRKKT